jgi:hypothetical protein
MGGYTLNRSSLRRRSKSKPVRCSERRPVEGRDSAGGRSIVDATGLVVAPGDVAAFLASVTAATCHQLPAALCHRSKGTSSAGPVRWCARIIKTNDPASFRVGENQPTVGWLLMPLQDAANCRKAHICERGTERRDGQLPRNSDES